MSISKTKRRMALTGSAILAAAGLAAVLTATKGAPVATMAYADGRLVEVDAKDLTKLPPANAGRNLESVLTAGAIIGYYDKGYNYHAQHMKTTQVQAPVALTAIEGRDLSNDVASN